MTEVTMYSTRVCPYCMRAEALLKSKGVSVTKILVDNDPALRAEMEQRTGRRTVPQIFIGETHVGGFDDLDALNKQGKLDALLGK